MNAPHRRTALRRGVAAVEFAVLLPLILLLLLGIWEVGRIVHIQQILSNSAREGARQAATGQYTNAEVEQMVKDYLSVAGLPTANVTAATVNLTHPTLNAKTALYLDVLQVSVSIPYNDVRWTMLSLNSGPDDRIQFKAEWVSTKDQPYPSPVEAPVG